MTTRMRSTTLKQCRIVPCQCGKIKREVMSVNNAYDKMIVYCPDCLPKKKCDPVRSR